MRLTENVSYQLSRVQVHEFSGKQELTYPAFGASATLINDLESICPTQSNPEDEVETLVQTSALKNHQKSLNASIYKIKTKITIFSEHTLTSYRDLWDWETYIIKVVDQCPTFRSKI